MNKKILISGISAITAGFIGYLTFAGITQPYEETKIPVSTTVTVKKTETKDTDKTVKTTKEDEGKETEDTKGTAESKSTSSSNSVSSAGKSSSSSATAKSNTSTSSQTTTTVPKQESQSSSSGTSSKVTETPVNNTPQQTVPVSPTPAPAPVPEPEPDPTPVETPSVPVQACPGGIDPNLSCDTITDSNYYYATYSSQSEADAAGNYYMNDVCYIGEAEITRYSVQPVYRNDGSVAWYGLNLWSYGSIIQ